MLDPLKYAAEHNAGKLIEWVGWLKINDIPSYIKASKFGVFTPPVNRDEINKTIATKIYQYVTMGTGTSGNHLRNGGKILRSKIH